MLVLIATVSILLTGCKKDDDSLTVKDIDGNVYKTVVIGTQIWLAENLKTIKYNDGASIPLVTDNTEWKNLATPGYCWYGNDEATNKDVYGALYNWYAVETGKLCPKGWHVPSYDEMIVLDNFVGDNGGGKLKETGTLHWSTPNTGAIDRYGFRALPGGYRNFMTSFGDINTSCAGWTSTPKWGDAYNAYIYIIYHNDEGWNSVIDANKKNGYSVRCLKD